MIGTVGLAALAGLLSTLSPCVLPLVPIVVGAAAAQHRLAPAALALGLALSFTAIGLFVATIGFAAGLDGDRVRQVGAVLLIGLGLVLALPPLRAGAARLAGAAGGGAKGWAGEWASARLAAASGRGLSGQFGIGLLLGAAWSPCVGPTLGAASLLAARGENLPAVAVTMLAFGLGAAVPLLLIGLASRRALSAWRGRLGAAGAAGRTILGALLVCVGLAVLTGLDRRAETLVVEAAPDWLTALTTRF